MARKPSQATARGAAINSNTNQFHGLIARLFLLSTVPLAISSIHDASFHAGRPQSNLPRVPVAENGLGLQADAKMKSKRDSSIPIKVTNLCSETVWPAFASQAGTGPETNGFELATGKTQSMTVGSNWQGRIWGRTNCTFNADGTAPSNPSGGKACHTGDCNGVLNCVVTGDTPVTLAEFDLEGGSNGGQTFYDISLVDGYNLPLGLTYIPGDNPSLQEIPPNLTNAACIATYGLLSASAAYGTEGGSTNASFPIPYDQTTSNADLAGWCPWDLQLTPPTKPGDGVYPYPDDNIKRPAFDPCLSACAHTNSEADCCTGSHDSPQKCKPSLYSRHAKAVCPDAYSYAFDDQTSTFIIPSGGGWQVTFCPVGRSTNILRTFGAQLAQLASTGVVSQDILADSMNLTLIAKGEAAPEVGAGRLGKGSLGALVLVVAWAVLW